MTRAVAGAFWERLDRPGHDFCQLSRCESGWRLSGHAVFDEDLFCSLGYTIDCDAAWVTRSAVVSGSIGLEAYRTVLAVANGIWTIDGQPCPELDGAIDLDLGFTPATNILPLRRLNPTVEVVTEAAYLPFPELKVRVLRQTYRRLSTGTFRYTSPSHGYEATLTVSPEGFVTDYPGFWSGRLMGL